MHVEKLEESPLDDREGRRHIQALAQPEVETVATCVEVLGAGGSEGLQCWELVLEIRDRAGESVG